MHPVEVQTAKIDVPRRLAPMSQIHTLNDEAGENVRYDILTCNSSEWLIIFTVMLFCNPR